MTPTLLLVACQAAAIAYALVAGVFLTFSDFVMRSLGGARPAAGVEVMQVINREVFRSVFMVLLLGMCAVSPLMIAYAWFALSGAPAMLVIASGAIYLVGVLAVSLVFNIPMNDRLAARDFAGPEAAAYWAQTYLPRWTFWNYVRAAASTAAAVCLLAAGMGLAQATAMAG